VALLLEVGVDLLAEVVDDDDHAIDARGQGAQGPVEDRPALDR
jgi:hypothetical protein